MEQRFIKISDQPKKLLRAGDVRAAFPHVMGVMAIPDADLAALDHARCAMHPAPEFDPETQVQEEPLIEQDPDDTWHFRTPVRAKTRAELDAEAASASAEIIAIVRAHSDWLIDEGIILEGEPFRGDGKSRQRLEESIDGLERGLISEAKFMTAAGVPYLVDDPAILANLRDRFIQYGTQVLAASTDLQQKPPATVEDVPGNAAWPAVPNITIADITPPA